MRVRAGSYRHLVAVQRDSGTQGSDGHETPAWATVAQVRASIEAAEGREFFAGAGVVGRQPVLIEMYYDSRFAAIEPSKWRVTHGSVVYDIVSAVNVQQRNKVLVLTCVTGSAVPSE